MKKINIKESLLQIDKLTDCKYDLTSLYEACRLDEKKKEKLVQYIDAYDHEGMSKFLQNEVGGCMNESCTDDLTDEELQNQLGEGFVHMTDETTCNPLVTGATLKVGDMVYDEETGHKLKVLTIAPNSKYSREIGFGDTVNQRTFSQYVGNNSLWEIAVEGDTAYETDDDIEFEFHPAEDLTANLNKIDEGLFDLNESKSIKEGYRKDSVDNTYEIGDRVAQRWTDEFNVGTVVDIKEEEGTQYKVEWDYSEGPNVEWLYGTDISLWIEEENIDESKSIKKGVEYVKWVQLPDGEWKMWGSNDGPELDPDFLDRARKQNNIEYKDAKVVKNGESPEGIMDEGLWDDIKKVGKAVGSSIKNDTPIGRGLTQVARGIKNDVKSAVKASGLDKVGKAAKDAFKDTDIYKGYQADKGASVAAKAITDQKGNMRHPDNLSKYIVRMKDKYPMLDYNSSNSRITQEIKKVCDEKGWDFEQVLKKAGLKLRESLNESVDRTSLEAEIRSTVNVLLDDEYMPVVEVKDENDFIKIEVRAEVDYDMLTELSNKLDVVVQKYDSSAYFEPVTSGIINAFVEKEPRSNEVDFETADYWSNRFADCVNIEELRSLYRREYMKAREDMSMATTDVIWEVVKDMMQKLDEEYTPMVEAMMNLYEEVGSTFKSLVDDSDLQILETNIVPGTNSFKAEYISGDSEGRVYNFIEADKAGYDYVASKGCDPDDLPTEVFKGKEVREGAYFITENDFEEFPKPNPVNEGLLDQTWHDVYKKFLDIVDSKYNGTNVDELNNEIESLYASHKGEPAWDGAYRRWHEYDDEYDAEGNNIHEDMEDKWPWLKVYPQLEKAAQSVYISYNWDPDTSLEDTAKMDAEAAKVVKALVDEHKGEADWEEAYRRLLDTAPELELKESVDDDLGDDDLLEIFLQDIAQAHGLFNYKDIMNANLTSEDVKKLSNLRRKYMEETEYSDDDVEINLELIAREIANIIHHEGKLEQYGRDKVDKSKSIKESDEDDFEEDSYNKKEVISWLEDYSTAYEDITDFFGSADLSEINLESILGWIEDHDELYDDFLRFFEMDDESLTEATPVGYEGIPLQSLADAFKVEGPSHREASAPEFNPLAFNEANIPDNMRYKTFNADLAKDTIMVSWVTQEEFSSEDAKVFEEELIRFFKAIADHIGYKASFKVEYDVRCRESDDSFALNTVTINSDQLTEAWTDCYKELEGSSDDGEMEEALRTEDDWEYCPNCSERALKGTGDSTAVCDKCGAEFSIVHMPNNKLKILPSNESLTEADYEKFEIIPDNRPSKRYIGGKEVPYKDWDDAKAHFKDDYHITDYADELRQFIKSEGAHFTVEETTDGRLAIEIDNGDWKHDHIYVDSLVQTFFNNKGLWVSVEQDTTEEAEDDCYSAIHYYDLDSFTLEERPIEESLNESNIEKYIITAKEGDTLLYYNDSDDSFNTDINLATQYAEKEVAQDDYNMVKERYPSATIQSIYNLPLLNKESMNEDLTIPTKAIVNAQSLETSKERREALADIFYKASKGDSFTYGGVIFTKTEDAPGAIWKVTGGNSSQNGFMDAYFGDDLVKTLANKQFIGCDNPEDLEESAASRIDPEVKGLLDKARQNKDSEEGFKAYYEAEKVALAKGILNNSEIYDELADVASGMSKDLDAYCNKRAKEDNKPELISESVNDDLETDLKNSTKNFSNRQGTVKYTSKEDMEAAMTILKKHYEHVKELEDKEFYCVNYKGLLNESLEEALEGPVNDWYTNEYPDDEIGIEQLDGISFEDVRKDQEILSHCDTQVRERVATALKADSNNRRYLARGGFYGMPESVQETLEPESEDIPWDYETMEKELKIATNNFTAKGDRFNLGFQKEVDDAIDILKRYYRNVEAKPQDSTWTTIIYHDPIGEE